MKEKYYITTAIAYTSGKPHIGNTYEAILATAVSTIIGVLSVKLFVKRRKNG